MLDITNPRVLLWLKTRGLSPKDLLFSGDLDHSVKLEDPVTKALLPWGILYSEWILRKWDDWATELGFKRGNGERAHENAFLAGHTAEEFDAWLEKKVLAEVNPKSGE